MIANPTTDAQCLGQLTKLARELAPTTLILDVAQHLGSPRAVVAWLQSLPQSDDDGHEHVRAIQCDVWQRVRLFPDDPNCFERAFAALALLEALDPRTTRMLVTIDHPLRHTGVVENRGGRWVALDLFPRRNATDWAGYGITGLQGVHQYVGKPLLKFYLGDAGGKVADTLGEQEQKLADGQEKKPAPAKKHDKPAPPVQRPAVAGAVAENRPRTVAFASTSRLFNRSSTKGGGRRDEETQRQPELPAIAGGASAADRAREEHVETFSAAHETQRWGWG